MKRKKTAQLEHTLNLLACGIHLDRISAITWGIQNITARIAELRQRGIVVTTRYRPLSCCQNKMGYYVILQDDVKKAVVRGIIYYDNTLPAYRLMDNV